MALNSNISCNQENGWDMWHHEICQTDFVRLLRLKISRWLLTWQIIPNFTKILMLGIRLLSLIGNTVQSIIYNNDRKVWLFRIITQSPYRYNSSSLKFENLIDTWTLSFDLERLTHFMITPITNLFVADSGLVVIKTWT